MFSCNLSKTNYNSIAELISKKLKKDKKTA